MTPYRDLKKDGRITVGLCFSFPVQHLSIKSGKLIKWTKGFENEGAVGSDPVGLLTMAFKQEVITAPLGSDECIWPVVQHMSIGLHM